MDLIHGLQSFKIVDQMIYVEIFFIFKRLDTHRGKSVKVCVLLLLIMMNHMLESISIQ